MLTSLLSLGYEVHAAIIGDNEPAPWLASEPRLTLHHLKPPTMVRIGANTVRTIVHRRSSLNEALYASPQVEERLREIADAFSPDVVIADTLRTATLAGDLGYPTVVDLDDLYSDRYSRLAEQDDQVGVLGYFGSRIPAIFRPAAEQTAGRLLRLEAELVRRREIEVAQKADAVVVVSVSEALELERRSGRPVAAIPMAVDVGSRPLRRWNRTPSAPRGVFVGKLDYRPNGEALRWFAHEVVPKLGEADLDNFRLTVVGTAPDELRREVESEHIRFIGYADDLSATLADHDFFLAPMRSGTGVSTKVLDAMATGLPVIATSHAVCGISASDSTTYLRADNPDEMIDAIHLCSEHPAQADRVGAAGQQLVASSFSARAARSRWLSLLTSVLATDGFADNLDGAA